MRDKDITLQIDVRLATLPEHLKDPANFDKIQKAVLNTFISTCNHREVIDWATCKKCTEKMLERRLLLRKLGFKNPAQYMAWRKVHSTIKERFPLVDWKKENQVRQLKNLHA